MTSINYPRPTKVRVEFTDENGSTYNISIENPSKEGVTKLLDFADSISIHNPSTKAQDNEPIDTNFARVYGLLQAKFRFGSFSSHDVLEAYQQEIDPNMLLSVISTYLSRLAKRQLVIRKRIGSSWNYKLSERNEIIENKKQLSTRLSQLPTDFSPNSDNLYMNGLETESLIK